MAHKLYHTDATSTLSIRALSPHITTLSVPFARGGLIKIGARATLIRLPRSNSVAVFSPVTLTPEVKSTLASLGTVRYITATDIEHHIHLGAWHREYPDAKIIAPEGLPEKRKKQGNESVRFDVLGKAGEAKHVEGGGLGVDEEFDEEFDACYVPGHANRELVFCFKREKTLVEADLLFNLPATEQYSKGGGNPHQGLLTRLMCGINGTSGGAAKWQQRFIWYFGSGADRPSFNKSVQAIDKWEFDRIIPCHGDVIESGGKGVFRNIMAWHLAQTSSDKKKGA